MSFVKLILGGLYVGTFLLGIFIVGALLIVPYFLFLASDLHLTLVLGLLYFPFSVVFYSEFYDAWLNIVHNIFLQDNTKGDG